jgi:hypothetical protein
VINSAVMILSEFGNKAAKGLDGGCEDSALIFLNSVVVDIVDTAKCFDDNLAVRDLDEISPFLAHSIYKAVLILTDGLAITQGQVRVQSLSLLMHALHQTSRRWLSASMAPQSLKAHSL